MLRLTLQRHLSTLTKFAPVESWCFDRSRQDKAGLYAPVYLDVKKPFRISVAVGLLVSSTVAADLLVLNQLLAALGTALLAATVVEVVFARQLHKQLESVLFPGRWLPNPFGTSPFAPMTFGADISAVYPNRSVALSAFISVVLQEHQEIRVMASTLAGLSRPESQGIASALRNRINKSVRVRFLLIHPAVADLRANQESRRWSEMGLEILHTLTVLRDWGVPPADIRLYRGLPTWFAIITSNAMVFSLYQATQSTYDSPTLILERAAGSGLLYDTFSKDFERAWASNASEQFDDFERVANEIERSLVKYSQHVRQLLDIGGPAQ